MGAEPRLQRVNLEDQVEQVQAFFRALPVGREGCVLVVNGKPLLKVLPVTEVVINKARLKEAILSRRDESRGVHQDWEGPDRERWDKIPDSEE